MSQEGGRFLLYVYRAYVPSCIGTCNEVGVFGERVDHPNAVGVNVQAQLVHTPCRSWDDFFLGEARGEDPPP